MDYSDKYQKSFAFLLKHEGTTYTNDASDPGGPTKYGISQAAFPDLDIASLTEDEAKDIYFRDWWGPLHCEEILDDSVAMKIFDLAVNFGSFRLICMAQQALVSVFGVFLDVDGRMGPKTIAAINQQDPVLLYRAICCEAWQHYQAINNQHFSKGWLLRSIA